MKNISLFAMIVFLCNIGTSQKSLDRLAELNEITALENEKARFLDINAANTSSTHNRNTEDLDGDGMNDQWELDNDLDPNDRKDAYDDNDGDNVINIYEYTLQTDPNDSESPRVINYTGSAEDLENFLEGTPAGSVIRIGEGSFDIAYRSFVSSGEIRIMIQGGWNSDFTTYDPKSYATVFDNNSTDETFYFNIGDLAESYIVLDGLTIRNSNSSVFSAITFICSDESSNKITIGNCLVVDNMANALTLNHWDNSTNEVHLHNVTMANNINGINSQVTGESVGHWTIDNLTIVNQAENGIDAFTLGTAYLNMKQTNVICNRNAAFDLDLSRNMDCALENCNYQNADVGSINSFTEEGTIAAPPLFVDEQNENFTLVDDSPLVDAGVNVGLRYNGSAPDLGANESGMTSSVSDALEVEHEAFPNPTSAQTRIDGLTRRDILLIYGANGQLVDKVRSTDGLVDFSNYVQGMYTIKILKPDGSVGYTKIVKR